MEVKLFKKIKEMLGSDDDELIHLGYEILCHHEEDKDRVEMIVLSYINKQYIPDFANGELNIIKNLFPYDSKSNYITSSNTTSATLSKHPFDFNRSYNPTITNPKNYKVINLKNKNQQK